jgi:UPF0755 protein
MDELTPPGAEPVRPRRRRASLVLVLLALLLVVGGLVAAGTYYRGCQEVPAGDGGTVTVDVPEGATGEQVMDDLHAKGLIPCAGIVGNLRLRSSDNAADIRTGTYELSVGMTLDEILAVLTAPPPKVPTYEVLFPEGLRIRTTHPGERTISSIAHDTMGLSETRFADLAESGRFSLPPYLPKGTPTAEGFLFPKTYEFVKHDLTERDVIERMLEQFDADAADLPWANAERLGLSPYEVVIVASMIEREAGVPHDRALIAGVIYNRLRDGMQLGVDATLLYDDPTPDGQLTTSDLETNSPYNTRINTGLPPTPIANPGRDSLEAALEPATTPYLYYVLCPQDGQGVSRFARTYDEHLRNVQECLGG